MPSIEGRHDERQIFVPVAILASKNPSDLTHIDCRALLDTGATSSGIGPRVISDLGLRSHQKKPLSVATEMRMVDYFLFRIAFKAGLSANGLPYVFAETDGFSWVEPKQFDVILGMDVLSQCDFRMDRSGRWQLTFA